MKEVRGFTTVFNVEAAREKDFTQKDEFYPTVMFSPHQLRLNPRNQIRRQSETFRLYKTEEMTKLIYGLIEMKDKHLGYKVLTCRNMLKPPRKMAKRILEQILKEKSY